jgi:Raf kinase inhibitor-like YbhB/YbcL family protein
MQLISSAFAIGSKIPRRYTCDADDASPPLAWSGAPPETRSFVLLCDDPDAPGGTWHHWGAYDIPATQNTLPEAAANQAREIGFKQATNDFKRPGYGGPCPPPGHGPHRYHFRLLALSVDRLALRPNTTCQQLQREARKHALAEAIIVGTYER